jgi:hypothetical protein
MKSIVILIGFRCLPKMPGHESQRERPSEQTDEDEQAHINSSPLLSRWMRVPVPASIKTPTLKSFSAFGQIGAGYGQA